MTFILPRWVNEMPEGIQKQRAANRFYLKIASVYATPNGRIYELADCLGIRRTTLSAQMHDNRQNGVTFETFERVARLLGPEFAPPEVRGKLR